MPDLGQWLILLVLGIAAAVAVGWPLRREVSHSSGSATPRDNPEHEGLELRHRVALEGLRDVEADRRAGSLDDAAYERERGEAEERAARTLAELEAAPASAPPPATAQRGGRRAALWLAVILGVGLLAGFALPGPIGLGQHTVVDQALADQLAAESARQAEIQRLLGLLGNNPQDAQVLSDLADAYLAGDSSTDLQHAAVALRLLLALDPRSHSAYQRLITAYFTAGDLTDATATIDSYAAIAGANEPDIPFFRGLIALARGDSAAALAQFDRFLTIAGDDPRAAMIRSLRAEAAGELATPSP
ncbi:MAG TPA: c-type cytochrome biogenesis protein CcmI [Candidatus Saccharimonadales bacterium]|nr:c-type cytochrome biogenesis protein CcmI [Candidatus Saccharimonadales bacterium]